MNPNAQEWTAPSLNPDAAGFQPRNVGAATTLAVDAPSYTPGAAFIPSTMPTSSEFVPAAGYHGNEYVPSDEHAGYHPSAAFGAAYAPYHRGSQTWFV
jgi:hypothetical protein